MKCYTSVATATEERLTERPWALVTRLLPGVPLDRFARAVPFTVTLGCHEGDEGYENGHRQHAGGRFRCIDLLYTCRPQRLAGCRVAAPGAGWPGKGLNTDGNA